MRCGASIGLGLGLGRGDLAGGASLFVLLVWSVACGPAGVELQASRSGLTDGTPHDQHPSVVLIEVQDRAAGTANYCSGTLVGSRTVLTAAHCLSAGTEREVFVEERAYAVAELIVHEAWDENDPSYPNDIGLIRLTEPVTQAPSPLSPLAPLVGLEVTLVGFGATRDGATDFGIKRIASNTIEDIDEKRVTITGTGNGRGNTCEGDSGGPVFANAASGELLIGVNSAGEPPCGTRGVATRVDTFLDWIAQKAGDDIVVANVPADALCRPLGRCPPARLVGGCDVRHRHAAGARSLVTELRELTALGLLVMITFTLRFTARARRRRAKRLCIRPLD